MITESDLLWLRVNRIPWQTVSSEIKKLFIQVYLSKDPCVFNLLTGYILVCVPVVKVNLRWTHPFLFR